MGESRNAVRDEPCRRRPHVFEDSGGAGAPVLFYSGFADPLEVAKASRLAQALSGEFRLIFAAAGCWDPNVPAHESDRAWARSAWEALRPYSTGGNYVNVQTADDDDTRLREAYRDSLDRLAKIKATYDPHNLFRVNRNIPPAGVAPAAHATPGHPDEPQPLTA